METADVIPNHHFDHPGFSGWSGLVAALGFLKGRDDSAQVAIDVSGLRSGDRVVDIGCGPGVAVQMAHDLGAEVVGVDPAKIMLRVAKLKWRKQAEVSWKIGTAESLPVADGWATVVWSLATVHHWADLEAGLEEAKRILAPGGRFVALERQIEDPYAEGVASHGWTAAQAETFAQLCRDHGFTDVAVTTHPVRGRSLAVLARRP